MGFPSQPAEILRFSEKMRLCQKEGLFGKQQGQTDFGCPPSERFPFCARPRARRPVAGVLLRGVHRVMPAWGGDVLPSTTVRLSCISLHRAGMGLGPCRDGAASHPPHPPQPFSSFLFFSTFPSVLPRLLPSLLSQPLPLPPRSSQAPKGLCTPKAALAPCTFSEPREPPKGERNAPVLSARGGRLGGQGLREGCWLISSWRRRQSSRLARHRTGPPSPCTAPAAMPPALGLLLVLSLASALQPGLEPPQSDPTEDGAALFASAYNSTAELVLFESVSASWNYYTNLTTDNAALQVGGGGTRVMPPRGCPQHRGPGGTVAWWGHLVWSLPSPRAPFSAPQDAKSGLGLVAREP